MAAKPLITVGIRGTLARSIHGCTVYPGVMKVVEIINVLSCLVSRQFDERSNHITHLKSSSYNFLTGFAQRLWITRATAALLVLAICTSGLTACSTFRKEAQKPKETRPAAAARIEDGLVSKGPDEVRKQYGEPTSVAKTQDDHILWIYEPTWKIMPDDKGTLYVEFEKEKVIKAFRK